MRTGCGFRPFPMKWLQGQHPCHGLRLSSRRFSSGRPDVMDFWLCHCHKSAGGCASTPRQHRRASGPRHNHGLEMQMGPVTGDLWMPSGCAQKTSWDIWGGDYFQWGVLFIHLWGLMFGFFWSPPPFPSYNLLAPVALWLPAGGVAVCISPPANHSSSPLITHFAVRPKGIYFPADLWPNCFRRLPDCWGRQSFFRPVTFMSIWRQ